MTATIDMIKKSLEEWEMVRVDGKNAAGYFEQGNSFFYYMPTYALSSDNIHAYPGIWQGKLYFFMIPEAYDKPEYAKDIADYVTPCLVNWGLTGSHTIPFLLAEERVNRWSNNYKDWCMFEVKKPWGIFKAFNIPADDIPAEQEVVVTLGLQITGNEGIMSADVIMASVSTAAIIEFDDFAKPVPPYSPVMAEDSFYLLKL